MTKKNRNKYRNSSLASVMLLSAVVPAIVVGLDNVKAAETETTSSEVEGFHAVEEKAIKDLKTGQVIGFAGQVFVLLDKYSGHVVRLDNLDIGKVGFDKKGVNKNFTPTDEDNIAYYLNNTYLDTFSDTEKAAIKTTNWGVGGVSANEAGSDGRTATLDPYSIRTKENLSKVSAKIGMMTVSDYGINYYNLNREVADYWLLNPETTTSKVHAGKSTSMATTLMSPGNQLEVRPAFKMDTNTLVNVYDYEYSVENGEVTIEAYFGSDVDLVIPNELDGMPVTAIGADVFNSKSTIKTVTLNEDLRTIGENAFRSAYNITSINFNEKLETVGNHAFYGLTRLESLNLNSNLKSVGDYSFYGASKITSLTLNDNLETVGNSSFQNLTGLTELNLGENLTTIGKSAFADARSVTELTLPSKLEHIGDMAFRNIGLEELTIPSNVISLGTGAFSNTTPKLKKVYVLNKYLNYIANNKDSISLQALGSIYGYVGSTTQTIYGTSGFIALDEAIKQPTILSSNITSGQTYKGNVKPEIVLKDAESVEYTLDGTSYDGVTAITTLGEHTLVVKATNGVLSTTKTYKFTISENKVPTADGTIETQQTVSNKVLNIDLEPLFSDLDLDNLTYEVESSSTRYNEAWVQGTTLKFVGEIDDTYTLKVRATDGSDYSDYITFDVVVSSEGVEPPTEPTTNLWTLDNPTGSTERLKRNVTIFGGKVVTNLLIKDIEYTQTEITIETEYGTVILKPDGNGNTLLNIPEGLGTADTSTEVNVEYQGVNFLDIQIQAKPKVEFNFNF